MRIYLRIISMILTVCICGHIIVFAETEDKIEYGRMDTVFEWDVESEAPLKGEISFYMGEGRGCSIVDINEEHGKGYAIDSTKERQIVVFETSGEESEADIITFDVYPSKNTSSAYAAARQSQAAPTMKRMFDFTEKKQMYFYQGMDGNDLYVRVATPAYDAEKWYKMTAVIDYKKRNVTYFINGDEISSCQLPDDYKRQEGFYYVVNTDGGGSVHTLDNIYIYQVKERGKPLNLPDGVGITEEFNLKSKLTSDSLGQIFFDKEVEFFINPINLYNKPHKFEISYDVVDEYGKTIYENKKLVEVEGKSEKITELFAKVDKFGFYTLNVKIQNQDHIDDFFETSIQFSVVNAPEEGTRNSYMGVCSHTGGGDGSDEMERKVKLFAKAGFSSVRDGYTWKAVEKVSGTYDFSSYDTYDNVLYKNNMNRFSLIFGGSGNISGEYVPISKSAQEAYAKYAAKIVTERKDTVKEVEIWNEYNLVGNASFNPDGGTVQDYINMLKLTYSEIKKANSGVFVWGAGGICSLSTSGMPWLKEFFELGGPEYCDGISIHPYSGYDGPDKATEYIEAVHKLAAEYGYEDLPILSSEVGWNTVIVSEADQANYAIKHAVSAMGKVKTLYWYNDQEKDSTSSESEKRFGMIRGWTIGGAAPYPTYSAKPMFVALANWNALMTGAEPVKKLELKDVGAYLFKDKNNQDVVVIWNEDAIGKNIGLKINTDKIKVYDIYGNATEQSSVDGVFDVEVKKAPSYIIGNFDSVELESSLTSVSTQSLPVVLNDEISFSVTKRHDENAKIQLELPDNISLLSSSEFDDNKTANIRLKIGSNATDNEKIKMRVIDEAGSTIYSTHTIEVLYQDTISYRFYTVPVTPRRWEYRVDITNSSNTNAVSGKVKVIEPSYIKDLNSNLSFEGLIPRNTKSFAFAIPENIKDVKSHMTAEVELSNGEKYEFGEDMYFSVFEKTNMPPIIDGKLSEGEWNYNISFPLKYESQVMKIPKWTEENLSGKVYTAWDKEYFYIGAEVIDDVDAATGTQVWQNDSIQFAFANEKRADGKRTEYGIGILNGKADVERYAYMAIDDGVMAAENAGDLFEDRDIQVAITRDEDKKTTYYEAKFSWEEIFGSKINPNNYQYFVFSMLINDNDGEGRTGWIEYCPGIGNSKDIMEFIKVPLYKEFGGSFKIKK